jgi:WD40 repeat protein
MVEIRNQLTFQLLAVLQTTKNISAPTGPPAYSSDGQFLAGAFFRTIVIWDVQTGGVAREIRCYMDPISLVWSLDGRSIATILSAEYGVETYDVTSGARLSLEKPETWHPIGHLWAYEKTFRFMTQWMEYGSTLRVSTFEIGPPLISIESFTVYVGFRFESDSTKSPIAFSPSTYRASMCGYWEFIIFDIRDTNFLFRTREKVTSYGFSSDGSFCAAAEGDKIRVRKYTSGDHKYILWKTFLFPPLKLGHHEEKEICLQFSPALSSVLCQSKNVLHAHNLDSTPTTPETRRVCAGLSRFGNYIVTAKESETNVAIIDLNSRTPPQLMDTGVEIRGLVIAGNVLLVVNEETVMGWLLTCTEEGSLGGTSDNQRTGWHADAIWTMSSPYQDCMTWTFGVKDQVARIAYGDICIFTYHTGTGEDLEPSEDPRLYSHHRTTFSRLSSRQGHHYFRYSNRPQYGTPPKDLWPISPEMIQETGWVIDPEGRHRFWVPVEWRWPWKQEDWHHDIKTLFTRGGDQLVVIKF